VRELVQKTPDSDKGAELDLRACSSLLFCAQGVGLSEKEARVLYSAGKDLATRKGDLQALAHLNNIYAGFLAGYGLPDEALRYGEEALALAEHLEDPGLKLTNSFGLCRVLLWTGPAQRGLSVAEAGLEVSEAEFERTRRPVGSMSYGQFRSLLSFYKGVFLCLLGRPQEAEGWLLRAIEFVRKTGDALLVNANATASSLLYATLGDSVRMLSHAREAVQAAERLEAPAYIAEAYNSLGLASLQSGAFRDALAAYERASAVQEGFEWEPLILSGLAWTHLSLGDGETALKKAREAVDAARRSQRKLAQFAVHHCVAGVLLWTRGLAAREQIESALQGAAQAVAVMGARAYEPLVLIERARLARLSGDESRCRDDVSEAHRLLTEMGSTPRVARLEKEFGMRVRTRKV